jgi:Domain of unknown function (DUF5753)
VLQRPVATPLVMAAQLARLVELSEQANITLQVIPYTAGAHIGLQGGFAIADMPDLPGIVFLDTVADGQTVEDAVVVTQVTQRFDALRAEASPRGASRDMIGKAAGRRSRLRSGPTLFSEPRVGPRAAHTSASRRG